MDISALAQHILDTHHVLLKKELPRIDAALRLQNAPPSVLQPWSELRVLLESHLMKEEVILFPNILALARGENVVGCGFSGPIAQMNHEHNIIAQLEADLRAALPDAGDEADAIEAMLDDLAVHARREDEELFPAVLAVSGSPALHFEEGTDDSPSPVAETVLRMCRGAVGWHSHFRGRLRAFDDTFRQLDLSPGFMAPWGHFHRELTVHLDEEEGELFPALIAAAEGDPTPADGRFRAHLKDMQTELDEIRTIADALRVAAPEVGEHEVPLLSLLDDLEEHARRESEDLWPAATALLAGRRELMPPTPTASPRPPEPQRGVLSRAAHRLRELLGR